MTDPYSIIGVNRNATDREVKRAYKSLISKHHPDKSNGSAASLEQAKKINAAYETIKEERKAPPKTESTTHNAPPSKLVETYNEMASGFAQYSQACEIMSGLISNAKRSLRAKLGDADYRYRNKAERDSAEKILRILPIEFKGDRTFDALRNDLASIRKHIVAAQNGSNTSPLKSDFVHATQELYTTLIATRKAVIKNALDVMSGEADILRRDL